MAPPKKITAEGETLLQEVREILRQSDDLFYLRVSDCALLFGVGTTRFQEKLREAGATWLELMSAERKRRFDVAVKAAPGKHAAYYADRCGYWDYQSFYRAFRSWYGMGFGEWRNSPDHTLV